MPTDSHTWPRSCTVKELVLNWLVERARAHAFELIALTTGVLGIVSGWAVGSVLTAVLLPMLAIAALALRWWWLRRRSTGPTPPVEQTAAPERRSAPPPATRPCAAAATAPRI